MRRHQKTVGFTIVELLVVISIIAMLVAMLLPAVQAARAAARNSQCKSRLRQLAIAAQSYQTRHQKLPGFISLLQVRGYQNRQQVSWYIKLAPDLEENAVLDSWKNGSPIATHKPLLICPSDPTVQDTAPALSYMANAGRAESYTDGRPDDLDKYDRPRFNRRENGVFLNEAAPGNPTSSLGFVEEHDGSQRTMMFAENIQLTDPDNMQFVSTRWNIPSLPLTASDNGIPANKVSTVIVWQDVDVNSILPVMKINGDNNVKTLIPSGSQAGVTSRPSSFHAGGANASFCDGTSVWLSDQTDYRVYIQLMSPQDKKAQVTTALPRILDESSYRN